MQADLSKLFDSTPDRSGTNAIKVEALESIYGSKDVVPMWVADMDLQTAPEITQALTKRAQHGIFGYTEPGDADYQAVIDWMQNRYDVAIEKDWIAFATGVVNGLHFAVNALTAPYEKIVILTPIYPPFFGVVRDSGRTLVPVKLLDDENGSARMDYASIEQAFRDGARMLLLCSPHNPLGRVWEKEELEKLVDLCRKYGVYLISDEIHAGFLMKPHKHVSILSFHYEKSMVLISASKSFNLAGMGICDMLIPDPYMRGAIERHMRRYCIPDGSDNPFGLTAQTTAFSKCGYWLDALCDYIKGNYERTVAFLAERIPEIRTRPLQGTYLMWLDVRALGTTDEVFDALAKHGAGLQKGMDFGEGDQCQGFLRMNIACSRTQLEAALARMDAACADLREKKCVQ